MTHVSSETQSAPPFAGSQMDFHKTLARFNQERFNPANPGIVLFEPGHALRFHQMEVGFVEAVRQEAATSVVNIPESADDFLDWFEHFASDGARGHSDLMAWIGDHASYEQMRWYLQQELAGDMGFDDILALCQVRMPTRAKVAIARVFWDEMGRGRETVTRSVKLQRLARHFGIRPDVSAMLSEALTLGNLLSALASHRQYAFHSVGAIAMSLRAVRDRAGYLRRGLERLNVPAKSRSFFAQRPTAISGQAWNGDVMAPLVNENFARARSIAEGAAMYALCAGRRHDAYRRKFSPDLAQAAE